jgi:hypothetical protein
VTCWLTLISAPLVAQSRDELIRQAQQHYDNFETEPALNNLKAALDPTRGARDSLWAHAVHLLAQIYIEQSNPALARSWLRWAMRLNPNLRVDQVLFLPDVIQASSDARAYALRTASAGDSAIDTRWEWPLGRILEGSGQIRIDASGLAAPVRVTVGGRAADEGRTITLDAGSYDIQAAADGYTTVIAAREVLPNVTTVLRFNLRPARVVAAPPPARPPAVAAPDTALPNEVAATVRPTLVRLDVRRFGSAAECRVGFVAGATYLITTYDAIRGADSVEARFADGTAAPRGIRVAAYDAQRNVAVLKLPAPRRDSLPIAGAATADQAAWALTYQSCAPAVAVTVTRAPIVQLGPPLRTANAAPGGAMGGALVDRSGAAVGLVREPQTAIASDALRAVLAEARRRDPVGLIALADVARAEGLAPAAPAPAAPPTQVARGGGKKFPIAIVLGGLALAGGGAALLLGGGGGGTETCPAGTTGTPPNCTPIATTGGITISVPNR